VADGVGYLNAVENSDVLALSPRSQVDVGTSKLVNNGSLYAGAPGTDVVHIYGDLENNGLLLPCLSSLPAGHLYIHGAYTAGAAAQTRARIRGAGTDDRDHVTISDTANLRGALDVRLTDGFVPAVGDSFSLLKYSSRRGAFTALYLPALPSDRAWHVDYGTIALTLSVIAAPPIVPGDLNCDGVVNFKDINAFVLALSDPAVFRATYLNCNILNGDCNSDGAVNFKDINPFVALLSGN
jgi:hypothetical protein